MVEVSATPLLLEPHATSNDGQPRRRTTATGEQQQQEDAVKVNHGDESAKAAETKKWHTRDVYYISLHVFVHVLCLFAPFTFTWPAFWVALALYILTGLFGLSLSYHRNLTHKSFKLPKYLEYLFAYFGIHALQGDPIAWISTHRYHHKMTDTPLDPHSPNEGFMHSHINWIFDYNKIIGRGSFYGNTLDLMEQPYYRFLEKTVVLHIHLLMALLYAVGGFPFLVWGVGVRTVCTFHVTFIVNSVGHSWGSRSWNTDDNSRNNWYLAAVSFGEGWHNNHHAFEYSARHGLEWWQMDAAWYIVKLLESLGLATDVKLPSDDDVQLLSFKKGVEDIKLLPHQD